MMEEFLIWVDENDHEIGFGDKTETHINEHLHRAFSLFIFNTENREMLIQRRALGKYHSGGLWSNACCSHPRKGEDLHRSVIRRLREELGIDFDNLYSETNVSKSADSPIVELGVFRYYKKFDTCAEYEIDHVFLWTIQQKTLELKVSSEERAETRWIALPDLKKWLSAKPEDFTAWFPKSFAMVYNTLMQ